MRRLHDIRVLGLKELRVLARDRQAAALLFVMPAIFVFLLSLAVGDLYNEKTRGKLVIALDQQDEGEHGERLAEYLGSRSEIILIDLPLGATSEDLFRENVARATVRVPAGFSAHIDSFAESGSMAGGLGADRIEWAVSPRADAIYHSIVRVSLTLSCIRVLQDKLESGTRELASEMQTMGRELGRLAALLEDAVGQLESAAAQLGGDQDDVRAFAQAAAAERAAREEAERARAQLEAGEAEGGALVSTPTEGDADSDEEFDRGAAVETELIGVDPGTFSVLTDEQRAELERMLLRAEAPTAMAAEGTPQEMGEEALIVRETDEAGDEIVPNPLQQNVPGWSLFAMFFIVIPMSSALHRERTEGTTRRLLALAVARSTILIGKLCPYLLVGFLQFAAMVLVGMFIVPLVADVALELGPNPVTLLPVTLACSFAATSYGLLIATASRTSEQASAFGASSVVILSALGGVMIPHFIMPEVLQKAALASPIYWGHQAYLDVLLHGASVVDVALPIGILFGFGSVCLLFSGRRAVT